MRALGLAHHWQRLLDEGCYRPVTEIAASEGMDPEQAGRVAQIGRLVPDVAGSAWPRRVSGGGGGAADAP